MLGRRRTEVLAGVASIVAACVFVTAYFAQPLLGSQTVQAVTEDGGDPDVAQIFQPLHEYQYRYVTSHGVLPEWIEPMGLGMPEIDFGTTTNAYLPRLAVLRVSSSAQTGADILAWLEAIAGALGVLALARLYRLRWGAAVLAGASYPLTHVAVRWLPYFSLPVFMAAFPFVLLGIELIWRRRLLLGGSIAVAALGIGGLGGSVLFSQLAVQVAALLILYRLLVTRAPRRERLLSTAASGSVLGLGLLAASGGWLPFAVSQHDTVRTATTFGAIGGFDWTTLLSFLDPTAQASSTGINGDLYVSLVAPFLLALGIVRSVSKRRLGFIPLYALLLLLLGLKTPLLRGLIAFVPGWQYLSDIERYVSFLAALPLALLVGVGADALLRAGRWALGGAAALILVAVLTWELEMPNVGWTGWMVVVALLAAAGLAAAAASATRWAAAAALAPIAFLAVGVTGSLAERDLGWHPVKDAPDPIYRPWLRLVAAHDDPRGRWMSYCQPLLYSFEPGQSFTYRPNTFLNEPGNWLDMYVSFPRPDYFAYWRRLTGSNRYSGHEFGSWFQHTPTDPPPNLSLVNAAGVSRVLGSSACQTPTAASWRELASTKAVPTDRVDVAYANTAAFPAAYVSHRWEEVRGREEAIDALAAPANARFAAHSDYVAGVISSADAGDPVPARLERVTGTLLRVVLPEPRRSGLLVVLDRYDSNWRAYVDGHRSRIARVNGVFRGVVLPDGARTVTLRYQPWWTRWLFPLCWSLIAAALAATVFALTVRVPPERVPTWRPRRRRRF